MGADAAATPPRGCRASTVSVNDVSLFPAILVLVVVDDASIVGEMSTAGHEHHSDATQDDQPVAIAARFTERRPSIPPRWGADARSVAMVVAMMTVSVTTSTRGSAAVTAAWRGPLGKRAGLPARVRRFAGTSSRS